MDNEDKLLIQEYCYIRTKQEHKAPDVKKAWDQFEHEHIMKKQSLKTKRHVIFLRYAAAIAIILVMVMGGIGIWWSEGGKLVVENYNTRKYIEMRKAKGKEKLVAFESTKGPQKILIMDEKSINPTKRTTKKTEKVDTLHHKVFLATDILDVAFRKIITPRGKTFEITLSDGTQVALNADSKFTFPVDFAGKPERIVQLEGEAFFKVKKAQGAPFRVYFRESRIEVTGTEFNIKAGHMESEITLFTGSIKFQAEEGQRELPMQPNERIVYNTQAKSVVRTNIDINEYDWRSSKYRFTNKPLQEFIDFINRSYHVNIIIKEEKLKELKFNGTIRKDEPLTNIIEKICISLDLKEKQENNNIILY